MNSEIMAVLLRMIQNKEAYVLYIKINPKTRKKFT